MFNGHNQIGFASGAAGSKIITVFSTVQQSHLPEEFIVATDEEIEQAIAKATTAFVIYKKTSPDSRAVFLEAIADEIMAIGDDLIQRAMLETGLPEARLTGERGRTVNQLKLFASVLREGSWVEAVIDAALPDRKPLPRPDLRKMLCPLGPVAVFGASNFPFAFSTAGGDTASALAAGCPVIVKAHSAHLGTNELVATAITKAAVNCGMPDGVFSSLIGEGSTLGQTLAKHPGIKAIGFTGSYKAGMSLFKTAVNDRETPIPVYAEMSSINPMLVLPKKVKEDSAKLAAQLAGSITLGVGQFCTNPGLLFVVNDEATDGFIADLVKQLQAIPEGVMLNTGICEAYYKERKALADEKGVRSLLISDDHSESYKGSPALFEVDAADFVTNSQLQNEVFGPTSLVVRCQNEAELSKALQSLKGQLTGSVFGTAEDNKAYTNAIEILTDNVGRLIYNAVPTGVEVSHAMVHGGPHPATTDGRSTSVGADAIKRFVRPICFQDCPSDNLPIALQNDNPLGILRKLDGVYTKDVVGQLQEA